MPVAVVHPPAPSLFDDWPSAPGAADGDGPDAAPAAAAPGKGRPPKRRSEAVEYGAFEVRIHWGLIR